MIQRNDSSIRWHAHCYRQSPATPGRTQPGSAGGYCRVVLLNDHGAVVVVTVDGTCHDDGVPAMVAVAPNTIAVVVERYLAVKWPVSPREERLPLGAGNRSQTCLGVGPPLFVKGRGLKRCEHTNYRGGLPKPQEPAEFAVLIIPSLKKYGIFQ